MAGSIRRFLSPRHKTKKCHGNCWDGWRPPVAVRNRWWSATSAVTTARCCLYMSWHHGELSRTAPPHTYTPGQGSEHRANKLLVRPKTRVSTVFCAVVQPNMPKHFMCFWSIRLYECAGLSRFCVHLSAYNLTEGKQSSDRGRPHRGWVSGCYWYLPPWKTIPSAFEPCRSTSCGSDSGRRSRAQWVAASRQQVKYRNAPGRLWNSVGLL